ncbi:hypothetical protein BaRGS_00012250 [Batillaria attramentaria]|uniref:Uncharacterized protein n=1 Tax=Batillaria attramentaria TaxID=370345 RepID=A0ABD0LB48_9CAEN
MCSVLCYARDDPGAICTGGGRSVRITVSFKESYVASVRRPARDDVSYITHALCCRLSAEDSASCQECHHCPLPGMSSLSVARNVFIVRCQKCHHCPLPEMSSLSVARNVIIVRCQKCHHCPLPEMSSLSVARNVIIVRSQDCPHCPLPGMSSLSVARNVLIVRCQECHPETERNFVSRVELRA